MRSSPRVEAHISETTCLMVSLVRKKGKYEIPHTVEALSDRIFQPFMALFEFPFTSLPLKLERIFPFSSWNRDSPFVILVLRKAICSTELFDSSFQALALKDFRLT